MSWIKTWITTVLVVFLTGTAAAGVPGVETQSIAKATIKTETLAKPDKAARAKLVKAYGKMPLAFEINEGQTDGQVKFLTRGSGYSMFFTPTESVLVLSKPVEGAKKDSNPAEQLPESKKPQAMKTAVVRMQMVGANPAPKMFGEDILPGKSNYLIGNDPKKWRTDVSNYKKVRYEEVYPGIDLVYYGNQRKLEYDFIVKPGADPKAIQLAFDGIESYSIENGGDLVLHMSEGNVIQQKPVIYQEIDGKRIKVAGNYMFLDDEKVAFHLGAYDKTQPLVIDPVLIYSTYLGGNGSDQAFGIAVDASGAAYVAGWTRSTDFPTLNPLPGGGVLSGVDAFVSKLNAAGNALIYSTYLGGTGNDQANGIAVDASGAAYVAGFTGSTNFPTLNP
ncbi:MAG: SBBP repeat-containing protein, partial [Nitrospinales bacterium]